MAETLIEKVCTPCCGGIPPLTREEAERYLSVVRNGKLLDDGHLLRRTSYTHTAPLAAVMLAALLISTLVSITAKGALPMSLTLTSPAFAEGGEIPARYTCEGDDISPPLAWSEPPAGTRSLVLIVADPDAPDPQRPKTTWVHWVLYDLPPAASALPENVG